MAEKLKISVRQLFDLRRALNSLDAAKGGNEGEILPFDFDYTTRYRLMKDAAIVEREALYHDRQDRLIMLEFGVFDGMDKTEANGRKVDAYNRKAEDARDTVVELDGILFVDLKGLINKPLSSDAKPTDKAKTNQIPQTLLARLAPIISEESEA